MPERMAALPMYDFAEIADAHDALWGAVAAHLRAAGVSGVPSRLIRGRHHASLWGDPRLLFGQGCEYPLARSFADCVRLVASPKYTVAGCEGARHRSAIVVRRDDAVATLEDLRHRRCVINDPESNSGMNLLRAAIAPLAGGRQFFTSVVHSGSHRRSAALVAAGAADVAALDCVSYAHFRQLYPSEVSGLRVLAWTASSPSLPIITARANGDAILGALRGALTHVTCAPELQPVRERLFLEGFDLAPAEDFEAVRELERRAVRQGYPRLV